jgi:hypothetical protein
MRPVHFVTGNLDHAERAGPYGPVAIHRPDGTGPLRPAPSTASASHDHRRRLRAASAVPPSRAPPLRARCVGPASPVLQVRGGFALPAAVVNKINRKQGASRAALGLVGGGSLWFGG